MTLFSKPQRLMITILTAVSILFFSKMPILGAAAPETFLRVGLFYNTTSVAQIRIESAQGFLLMRETEGQLEEIRSLEEYTVLDVSRSGAAVVVKDIQGVLISNDLADESVLMSAAEDSDERFVSVGSTVYRDGVCFNADPTSGLTVINYVSLEHYLRGVLSREMSPGYPAEALKAQAVSARSFALENLGKHSRYGFDLCSNTCCQVYTGVDAEYPQTDEACLSTLGEVLVYDGKIAAGYYFAYSGGYTQNSEDVWTSTIGYLRSVQDGFAPDYFWTAQLSFSEIRAKLEAAGYDPGTVLSVRVGNRLTNGSVAALIVEGSKETVTLSKERVRTALGASTIRSVRFSMGGQPEPAIEIDRGQSGVALWSATGAAAAAETLTLQNASGEASSLPATDLVIWDGHQLVSTSALSETQITFTDDIVTGGTVYFKGMGYGHGVGMPQTSAREMANQGYGYQDILRYYYTDIEICQANECNE
ncbi:MAG: SpoIID/LytB domain-containing protein [Eubacteriales bacterium]|nr:SpoIID/LytB domain-containing protein [Eubacteriales bacterium]